MTAPGHERLPLFPLGLVLFPGLVLPLHVFEERYRVLVRELLSLPEERRRFGVVAIREGREVGDDGVRALYPVGCVAQLERSEAYPDGRFDIVSTGAERFRLHGLERDRPYLTGVVELLPEADGDLGATRVLGRAVAGSYAAYLQALTDAGSDAVVVGELPDDLRVVSYLVAATLRLDLAERQTLLEQPDTASRLRAELALLKREAVLLQRLRATPAPELARSPLSLN